MLFAPFVTRCNSANGVQRLRLMSDSRNLVRRQYSNKNLEKIQRIFSKIFAYLENLGVQYFNFVIFILKLQVLVSHFNDLKFTISTTKVLQVALSAKSVLLIFCHLVSKQRDDAPQWRESTKSSSILVQTALIMGGFLTIQKITPKFALLSLTILYSQCKLVEV